MPKLYKNLSMLTLDMAGRGKKEVYFVLGVISDGNNNTVKISS